MPTHFTPADHADATSSRGPSATADADAGSSLAELERRQDDVLAQLDQLDLKLSTILRGLGVTLTNDQDDAAFDLRLSDLDENESNDVDEVKSAEPMRQNNRSVTRRAA